MSHYCIKCKKDITDDEYFFSNNNFGKALCRIHQPTPEAWKLGKKLEEIGNWNVKYEYFDRHKSVDLRLTGPKVDIEVDGLQHSMSKEQALRDLKRAHYSYLDGFFTLHIPNILVKDDKTIDETVVWINNFLEENYKDVNDNWFKRFLKGVIEYL